MVEGKRWGGGELACVYGIYMEELSEVHYKGIRGGKEGCRRVVTEKDSAAEQILII